MRVGDIASSSLNGLDALVARLSQFGVSESFLRFAAIGGVGFCVDTATVYASRYFVGLYAAGVLGFLLAASGNWLLNRIWTYRHLAHGAAHRQWLRFLAVNSVGFVFNRGMFFTLITVSPFCFHHPIIGIIAGTLSGLVFNYFLSKKFVFGQLNRE